LIRREAVLSALKGLNIVGVVFRERQKLQRPPVISHRQIDLAQLAIRAGRYFIDGCPSQCFLGTTRRPIRLAMTA
jgi:hypothetical protein